jgi:diguanylate cyclase (GGDEF)-like protein
MTIQNMIDWIAGRDDQLEINRIYNTACFIATLFCLLAAIECISASLSPILIANNFFYSMVLALCFFLSRFKNQFGVSRFLGIFVLIFIYLPLLWIYNGGSASGIPYYILMFSSFLTILIVGKKDSKNHKTLSGIILLIFSAVVIALILLEYRMPGIFYQYEDESIRYFDIIISVLFALTSNFFILRAFMMLYFKQLDKVKEYSQQLEQLVIRDSMTNLYTHAFVLARLSEEIEKATRYDRPLSIIMLDLDHFKQVNDTYGHPFGDEVLVKFSQMIQSTIRSVDIAARYGGEEFLILLPETDPQAASSFARRLSTIVPKIQLSTDVCITVSGGLTQFLPGDTPDSMVARADTLLYEAKNEGRNRIKLSAC